MTNRKVCKNLAHNFSERELDGFVNNDNVDFLGRTGLGSFGLSLLVANFARLVL
jgi:hypothetical protein